MAPRSSRSRLPSSEQPCPPPRPIGCARRLCASLRDFVRMVRESAFSQLVSEFVWQRHTLDPVRATIEGVHDFEELLPDLTAAGFAERDRLLDRWIVRFENLHPYSLMLAERVDRQFAVAQLQCAVALRPFQ